MTRQDTCHHSTMIIRPNLELHLPDDPGLLLVRAAEHQHQVARVAVDLIIIIIIIFIIVIIIITFTMLRKTRSRPSPLAAMVMPSSCSADRNISFS